MTTITSRTTARALPAFARGPVAALAAAVGALLTAVSWRYGYFGDELYFVAAGHHLDPAPVSRDQAAESAATRSEVRPSSTATAIGSM
jgi:hypothetical protein